jgi:hypothetical protein
MIELQRWAELDVSAASGIVVADGVFYVVADDENFLGVYASNGAPLSRISLLSGVLPDEHAARKRDKLDIEALTALPDGRLVGFGSGSTAARRRGVLVDLLGGRAHLFDLTPLYQLLEREIPEVNVEGAAVRGDRLWLAQRGNGQSGVNALIELRLGRVLEGLAAGGLDAASFCGLIPVALGDLEGVPLGMTDLAAHPDHGLLFTAAAEASVDTYQDGACVGSVVGQLACDGRVLRCESISVRCKLEGIAVGRLTQDSMQVWLVADPDDRGQRAPLYAAMLSR